MEPKIDDSRNLARTASDADERRGRVMARRYPQRAIGCLLLLSLTLVGLQSTRLGLSGLVVEHAQHEADRWKGLRRPPPMSEINRVARYFADGLNFAEYNPWALEGLGALDLARVRLSPIPGDALRFAKEAYGKFRKALYERPASPYLWANLAMSKLYLDEIDAEFISALQWADELGPWEPNTQQVVLFAGLAAWDKLGANERGILSGVLKRGAVRNSRNMYEIVKSYRRYDLICGLSGYHVLVGAECTSSREPARAVAKPTVKGAR